jgi:hypothetical protein
VQVASQLLQEPAASAGASAAETTLDTASERTMAVIFILFTSPETATMDLNTILNCSANARQVKLFWGEDVPVG